MITWTPLFSKLVDSSVWCEPDHVRIVFITMLALKDYDDIVRCTPFQLSRRANKTEEEVMDALRVLSSPDTKRIEPQEFEGRRIQKIEGGWLILNGPLYRQMMFDARRARRRFYKTEWQRQKRSQPQTGEIAATKTDQKGQDAIAEESSTPKRLREESPEYRLTPITTVPKI